MKVRLLVAFCALICIDRVHAGDNPGAKHSPVGAHEKAVKEFDQDHDGKLSDAERGAAREAKREKMLEHFDRNHDGKLEPIEIKRMHEALEKRSEHHPRADLNHDGKVGPTERKIAEEKHHKKTDGTTAQADHAKPKGGKK